VGAFSFGLYLVHQPLVTWLGQQIKTLPVCLFLCISVGVLVALSAASARLERMVNTLTEHLLFLSKGGAAPKHKELLRP
jgi:peptidoglycan/LPS O-acetylase OafA/YrhL